MTDRDHNPVQKAAIRAQINENLRRAYQDTLEADVPDRFKQLLEQLRQKEEPK